MLSNDTSIRVPPIGGLYDYTTFKIGSAGFPAVGLPGYLDPIFGSVNSEGSTVVRLTDLATGTDKLHNYSEGIYGHHWANCNGTYCFWQLPDGTRTVISIPGGATIRSGIPGSSTVGDDLSWHPTDQNTYFRFSGSDIRKYQVLTGSDVLVNSPGKFPSALEQCGGAHDFVDLTGTKFCVNYGSAGHVYDSTTDTIYTGATSPSAGSTGIWLMTANAAFAIHIQSGVFTAYPLDNVNHVVGAGYVFWNDTGSHGAFSCATDGKVYMLRQDDFIDGYYYIIEVKDETGRTNAQQRTDNFKFFTSGDVMDFHGTGCSSGAFQNWIAFDTEKPSDIFDASTSVPPNVWLAYQNEIIAVNVLTHEVRRLVHHRSRSDSTVSYLYDYQPKVSSSWDFSVLLFLSNMNYSGNDAPDMFAIPNPLGGGATPATPPSGTFFFDDSGYPLPGPQGSPTTVSIF